MKKHNAFRRLLALLLFAALGFGLGGLPLAFADDKYDGVLNVGPYLNELTRPVAAFDHEKHQDILEDCASCHHGKTEDGRQDRDDYDPAESCDSCHNKKGTGGVTPLKRAYHQQCVGCHKDMNKGPTHCAGCHTK